MMGSPSNPVDDEQRVSSLISPRRIIIVVAFAVVVYMVLAWYADIDAVLTALASLPWWTIPTMMILSFANYTIRFAKWQFFLRKIDVQITWADSFRIFLAGFTLTATPGKIGEVIKGVFCRDLVGTPVAKTMPVVVSERVTDLLAMVILAMVAYVLAFSGENQLLLLGGIGFIVVLGGLIIGNRGFYNRIIKRMTKVGPLKRFQDSADLVEDTMVRTLAPKPMALTTTISVPGWFMECLELWLLLGLLTGTGLPSFTTASLLLLAQATFVHAGASVVGAVLVFLPGGLGGYEGFAQTALQTLLGLASAVAFAAVIIIRFVTLWFSIIVGFVALGLLSRRIRQKTAAAAHQT